MKHDSISSNKRKPVNLSIDTGVVATARAHGLNLSQISEAAIRAATKTALEARWQEDNCEAIEGWNRWVDKNGLPLEQYRVF